MGLQLLAKGHSVTFSARSYQLPEKIAPVPSLTIAPVTRYIIGLCTWHPIADGTNLKDNSFISGAVTKIFVFYIAAKRDYVKIPHSEEQGDPLDRLIRGRALSRKISGGHRHDMSSARASDFAVTKAASNSDAGLAACDVKPAPKVGRIRPRGAGADVGKLLRGAYRQTVEEAIPDDLLDLLNRLE